MNSNPNRSIYNEAYVPAQLEFGVKTPYDRRVIELRLRLLDEYCCGKDVLDLCCGTGTYTLHLMGRARTIVGLDFSRRFLEAAVARAALRADSSVGFVEADATNLPFADGSFDAVISISSLYYIHNVKDVIIETSRVLRPGGCAVLDLGNSHSMATLLGILCWRFYGWARPYGVPYHEMLKIVSEARLSIEQHHVFQILPLFGPKLLQLLLPLSSSLFKYPLGITIRGRLLDSVISGAPFLRRFAFRHLLVVRKAPNA